MKRKNLLVIIAAIIALIIAAVLYAVLFPSKKVNRDDTSSTKEISGPAAPPGKLDEGQGSNLQAPGKYIAYSEEQFKQAAEARRVLFFHAPWCPQCQALEKSIQKGQVPAGMVILKVDYDTSTQLRQQYGVTLQTTMVEVDKNSDLKQKFVAYDEPSLAAVVRALGE